jgi:SAM-dependent methyltransferase
VAGQAGNPHAGSAAWDERYGASELVWSATPNRFVEAEAAPLPPGRALDVAAGEGRNALWLAERGWTVTAVDFSAVGLERARRLAAERLGARADALTTVHADVTTWAPEPQAYDLVVVAYLQVPAQPRAAALRHAADAVAPGGRLLVVAHDSANLAHGTGGPQDPAVLYTADDVVADLAGCGLQVLRAERVRRPVDTPDGPRDALDALALLTRPKPQ